MNTPAVATFADLGLAEAVVRAVRETGYETPTPIQAAAIPPLLAGRDLLGQAQTGTGKTAAFALPLLSRLKLAHRQPQLLVLAPTRELAIQVAEAMQTYARHLPGFHVLPVYGGQGMDTQLRALKRGVHAVVGTPGRVADHLRRGTLKFNALTAVVLDEADEMLRMGFIDEVTGILEQTPADKQVALFSATMPPAISRIARSYLRDPAEIRIASKTSTVSTVSQHYWEVSVPHKLDALTRILEVEDFDAMLVFVRTRNATAELAERLEARGYASAALNGDMPQTLRERTIDKLKSGAIDILVATDVAARGLDVDRISHVINYDVPHDTEAYVHRIGRTGRAGRSGAAILFVAPRERRLLRAIEHATAQPIIHMRMPSSEDISDRRTARFKQLITDTIAAHDLSFLATVIEDYQAEHNVAAADIAAALAWQVQRDKPLRPGAPPSTASRKSGPTKPAAPRSPVSEPAAAALAPAKPRHEPKARPPRVNPPVIVEDIPDVPNISDNPAAAAASLLIARHSEQTRVAASETPGETQVPDDTRPPRRKGVKPSSEPLLRYRIAVGRTHGAEPRHIVGAIANESGLDSEFIGRVHIEDTHSTVELPEGMPKVIFKHLKKVWVCGQQLNIEPDTGPGADMRPAFPGAKTGRAGPAPRAAGKRPASAGFDKRKPAPRPQADAIPDAVATPDVGAASEQTPTVADNPAWPKDPSRSAGRRAGFGDGPAPASTRPARADAAPQATRKPSDRHAGYPSGAGKPGDAAKSPGGYRGSATGATGRPGGAGKSAPYRGKTSGPGKPTGARGKPGTGSKSAPFRGTSPSANKPGAGSRSAPFRGTSPSANKPGAGGKPAGFKGKTSAAGKPAGAGKPTLTRKGTVGAKSKPGAARATGPKKSGPPKPG